ncbi:MAG TPA: adenylate/guanylate cyclase domain-containing protein [Burkholderiales bacterium]|nr:adenylate/guanylate cyclase domain-containing protein [Burkholderiales bacterium]
MKLDAAARGALLLCAAAFACAFAIVAAGRWLGLFQELELAAYDAMLRARTPAPADRRIVLIHETEADLRRFGHPLSDAMLAQAIDTIEAQGPAAVGIDKYRDTPVGPGTAELDAVLKKHANLVWIFLFGTQGALVPAPAALRDTDKVGFNDTIDDPGGVIRRALVFLDDGKTTYPSLALGLALKYLQPRGVSVGPAPASEQAIQLGKIRLDPLGPDDGAYAGADAAGFQILRDYRSMPLHFETHTLADLIDGKVQGLGGKVVIFGANAESLGDQFYTPYSKGRAARERISGTELHGHITSQLIRLGLGESRPVVPWHRDAQLAYAALWCALGVLLFAVQRMTLVVLGGIAGVVVIAGISVWALAAHDLWIPLVPAVFGFVLTAGLAVSMRAALERRQRALVMNLFSKHVSPAVAREIWARKEELVGGGSLKPVSLTASMLFSDIRGFTPISEKLGPLGLARWIEVYMRAMSQPILDNDGLIRQYIGDAIMALFGVPVPRTTQEAIRRDALNAVRAAIGMRAALRELNARWAANGELTAGTRIGIHTGDIVTCSVGTAHRTEYTVLGDAVNTAARLESFPSNPDEPLPECRILISAATRELVKDEIDTEPVGELTLKGKTEKVFVYRVK